MAKFKGREPQCQQQTRKFQKPSNPTLVPHNGNHTQALDSEATESHKKRDSQAVLGVEVYACHLSTWEARAGGLPVKIRGVGSSTGGLLSE